jgi:hypothetical protein
MRHRPSFTVVGPIGQRWHVKTTDTGRVYYRACLVQFRDGHREARWVRDDLAVAA